MNDRLQQYSVIEKEIEGVPSVEISGIRDFNLDHIFDCGQCFRWKKEGDSYRGIVNGMEVRMSFEPVNKDENPYQGKLIIEGSTADDFENIWKNYLDLGRDYGIIKESLKKQDEVIGEAISCGEGIRILKQDLWETIVSFIISQNNNIPRIKGCIEKISSLYGDSFVSALGNTCYNIPNPEKMANLTEENLREVKLGYRSKYLIASAKEVAQNGLPENREELTALMGVGPKVANCIALFGMGDFDSFPIDVWMAKVMNRLYGIEEKKRKEMEAYGRSHFGQLGGIAQQYLFYYIREISKEN